MNLELEKVNQIKEKYQRVFNQLKGDDELMLKVLVEQFGGISNLWNAVQENITYLTDIQYIALDTMEERAVELENAFEKVLQESIQSEFLTEKINTISKTEEGYKLSLDNGSDVEITNKEVKEKILLQNNEFAFDHFAGLVDEEDLQAVFKIVDLYYVE